MTEGLEWFMLEPHHSLVIAHSFNECFSSSTVRGVKLPHQFVGFSHLFLFTETNNMNSQLLLS